MESVLKIRGLNKSYNVPVLQNFDLDLARGEVHALIGSNGAGKSTIAKILTGLTPRNGGSIELAGQPYSPNSKSEATQAGVIMVLQELNVIPTLTVAENLFLDALPRKSGFLDRKELYQRAETALATVGLKSIEPSSLAGSLGVGQQQLIEIASALTREFSVLILDEPTAALTGPEIDRLFENVNRLKKQGVAIIYISHRMEEIAQICDRVTILRDGRRIATHRVGEVPARQLIQEMAGSEIAERTAPKFTGTRSAPGLSIDHLNAAGFVKDVSLEAFPGEILGIAGLIGAGRSELLRAIFGADPMQSGSIRVGAGVAFAPKSPHEAVRAGIGMIPEDRKAEGLLLVQSIAMNATLATPDHLSDTATAETICNQLEVKRDSVTQSILELSGGNQQKVVIGRWLLKNCDVLLFDEPTRGIDVAAKERIYQLLDELAAQGRTILVVSSDLLELTSLCHRIVVMSNGRLTGEFTPDTWSQADITAAAFAGFD